MSTSDNEHAQLKNEITNLWQAICAEIEHRYPGAQPNREVSFVLCNHEGSDPKSIWKTELQNGILEFSAPLSLENQMLVGVLAREALRDSIPACIESGRAAFDLASKFGEMHLPESTVRSEWNSLWREQSPPTDMPGGLIYQPVDRLTELVRLDEADGFDTLIQGFYSIDRYETKLDLTDFAKYLESFVSQYSVQLTSLETRILDIILREPITAVNDIASRLDRSYTWTSDVMSSLRYRGILSKFSRVSLQSVGIRLFNLIITPFPNEAMKLIQWYPFLYSSSSVMVGRGGILVTLCIPDHSENIDSLKKLRALAKRKDLEITVFETSRVGTHNHFLDYNPEMGGWRIDWRVIGLEADHLSSNPSLATTYPNSAVRGPDRRQYIDEFGAKILKAFANGNHTVKEIRDEVKRRQADVSERFRLFTQLGIIREIAEAHHVGLIEEAIVTVRGNKTHSSVLNALASRLPRAYLHFDEEENLFMRALLPLGGARGLADAMAALKPPPEIRLIGPRMYGQWSLSRYIDKWNPKYRSWDSSRQAIKEWLNSI